MGRDLAAARHDSALAASFARSAERGSAAPRSSTPRTSAPRFFAPRTFAPRTFAHGHDVICLRAVFFALLFGIAASAAAQTHYVIDAFKLEARSGPSTSHKIVKILESGAGVTVLGERDGYSRIRLEDGTEAFMLSRYLSTEASARTRLEQALSELEQARARSAELEAELAASQSAAANSAQSRDGLTQERDRLGKELEDLKQTSAKAIEIRRENQNLRGQVEKLELELEDTHALNRSLSDNTRQSWLVAGGGVLFAGILMGIIIPKIRWQRRRGWNEL